MRRPPLTDAAGAYLLVIALDAALPVRLPGQPQVALAPGRYGYCGSARGPGGIAARVGRHLRPEKPRHWHVDRLTEAGRIIEVRPFPGGTECGLVRQLLALPGVQTPIAGFGSSDCRRCPAHLLALPDGNAACLPGILSNLRIA